MPAGAPPNPYQTLSSMPGAVPPKQKDDKTEKLMQAAHGIFKAFAKMEEMEPALSKDFSKAKAAIKNAFANVLKGDPSTLDAPPPPPSDDNTPPPPEPPPANPAADASAPPA